MPPERDGATASANLAEAAPPPAAAPAPRVEAPAPTTAPVAAAPATGASEVLGKTDVTQPDGQRACRIAFAYGGQEPTTVMWEEPCAATTVKLMDRRELEDLGRWERLDEFERGFVEKLPGGKVLYVGGEFTASVYPYGELGIVEVSIAD